MEPAQVVKLLLLTSQEQRLRVRQTDEIYEETLATVCGTEQMIV